MRRSRYTGANPPTQFRAILRALKRKQSRNGAFATDSEVRGALQSIPTYSERGPADDLTRYLKQHRIMVQNGDNSFYFDLHRGEQVASALDRGRRVPGMRISTQDQIARTKERFGMNKSGEAGTQTGELSGSVEDIKSSQGTDCPPTELIMSTAGEVIAAISAKSDPEPELEEVEESIITEPEPEPTPESKVLPAPTGPSKQFVMYLTPVEYDVWQAIVENSQVVDIGRTELRIALDIDLDDLYERWHDYTAGHGIEEYSAAVRKFINAKALEYIAKALNDRITYRVANWMDQVVTVRIDERPQVYASKKLRQIIRAVECGGFHTNCTNFASELFERWLRNSPFSINYATTRQRLFGFNLRDQNRLGWWGILHVVDNELLCCVSGFEAIRFTAEPQEATVPAKNAVADVFDEPIDESDRWYTVPANIDQESIVNQRVLRKVLLHERVSGTVFRNELTHCWSKPDTASTDKLSLLSDSELAELKVDTVAELRILREKLLQIELEEKQRADRAIERELAQIDTAITVAERELAAARERAADRQQYAQKRSSLRRTLTQILPVSE